MSLPPQVSDTGGEQYRPVQVLIADLRDLALDLDAAGYSPTTVAMFQRGLRRAVPSALGATISLELEQPVTRRLEVNLLDRTVEPAEVAAGLRVPLMPLQPSVRGSVLFYASAPAAFEDLARGLLLLLYAGPRHIELAPVLPSEPLSPAVAGLQDLSVVNQALGVLLSRGYSLDEARSTIRDHAARANTDVPEAARTLLDTLPIRRRDPGRHPSLATRPRDPRREGLAG